MGRESSYPEYLTWFTAEQAVVITSMRGEIFGLLKVVKDEPGLIVFDRKGALRLRVAFTPDGKLQVSQFDERSGEAITRFLNNSETRSVRDETD